MKTQYSHNTNYDLGHNSLLRWGSSLCPASLIVISRTNYCSWSSCHLLLFITPPPQPPELWGCFHPLLLPTFSSLVLLSELFYRFLHIIINCILWTKTLLLPLVLSAENLTRQTALWNLSAFFFLLTYCQIRDSFVFSPFWSASVSLTSRCRIIHSTL